MISSSLRIFCIYFISGTSFFYHYVFYNYYLFLIISNFELVLEISNFKNNDKRPKNDSSFSYNNMNKTYKILPIDNDDIQKFGTKPSINYQFPLFSRMLLFHMHISNIISQLFFMINFCLTVMLLQITACMFIDRQPYWNTESNQEYNMSSHKATSDVFPKKCDNLLVEVDTFTILGVSFCVTQITFNLIDIKTIT